MRRKTVLVASASVGTGHTRAAEAIVAAFGRLRRPIDAPHINVLDFTLPAFAKAYSRSYHEIVNRNPALWGYLYARSAASEARRKAERLIGFLDRINTRAFRKRLVEIAPDHVICTHFLPAEVIARLNRRRRRRIPFSIVVTDFDLHPFWLIDGADSYFAGNEEVAWRIRESGVPKGRVRVTGIPIHPDFSRRRDRAGARRRLGLGAKTPVILLLSGGYGVGDLAACVEAICRMRLPVQILAVAGRNRPLEAALRRLRTPGRVRLRPYGFVENMPDLMDAADILVGKSGGLVTSEALAKGLPMIVLAPTPGQEERNCDYLLEAGAAVRAAGIPSLSFKIRSILADPGRLGDLGRGARRAGRPRAASQVATLIADKLKKPVARS